MNRIFIILFVVAFGLYSCGDSEYNASDEEVAEVLEYYEADDYIEEEVDEWSEVSEKNNYLYLSQIMTLLERDYQTDNEIYSKNFAENFQNKYQSSDFDYTANKPKKSYWQQLMDKLDAFLDWLLGTSAVKDVNKVTYWGFRILSVLVIGAVIYFIIRLFLMKDGNWVFSKSAANMGVQIGDLEENIHELDFPSLIAKYESENQYRVAVRYWFLYLLKTMVDKELIEWDPEKTNRDYVNLLQGKRYQKSFKKLAYVFDNVWYGKRELNTEKYEFHKKEFQSVIDSL